MKKKDEITNQPQNSNIETNPQPKSPISNKETPKQEPPINNKQNSLILILETIDKNISSLEEERNKIIERLSLPRLPDNTQENTKDTILVIEKNT